MDTEKPKWAETLQNQISELKSDVEKLRAEMQEGLQELETRIRDRVREWTTRDPRIWAFETISRVAGGVFVASLVASVQTQGLYRLFWGFSIFLFGCSFVVARMAIGLFSQAPRTHVLLFVVFIIAIVAVAIGTMNQGYTEFLKEIKAG